jgi:hypothetical protein
MFTQNTIVMKRRNKSTYAVAAIIIFLLEVIIARYVNDSFVRPYAGDILAVILIYCAMMAVTNLSPKVAIISTLTFAFCVEIAQYFNVISLLGLEHIKLARIVIGTSFSWLDLVCYVVGIGIVWLIERTN